MQNILTQGQLPVTGASAKPAPASDHQMALFASSRGRLASDTEQSFTAIFELMPRRRIDGKETADALQALNPIAEDKPVTVDIEKVPVASEEQPVEQAMNDPEMAKITTNPPPLAAVPLKHDNVSPFDPLETVDATDPSAPAIGTYSLAGQQIPTTPQLTDVAFAAVRKESTVQSRLPSQTIALSSVSSREGAHQNMIALEPANVRLPIETANQSAVALTAKLAPHGNDPALLSMPASPTGKPLQTTPMLVGVPAQQTTQPAIAAITTENVTVKSPAASLAGLVPTANIPATPQRSHASSRKSSVEPAPQATPFFKAPVAITAQQSFVNAPMLQPTSSATQDLRSAALTPYEEASNIGPRSEIISHPTAPQSRMIQPGVHLSQHVARQISEALQQMPNRPVEISLNPEELGRVRLAMSSSEAGIVVNVLAERPETIDLMRRHIASLEAAFKDIGYSNISFSFSSGEQAQDDQGADVSGSSRINPLAEPDEQTSTPTRIELIPGSNMGLDIRL